MGWATAAERWYSASGSRCSRSCTSRPGFRASWLFWAAFILTRPLGATVGDFLDKPVAKGGLDLSRPIASLVLAVAIVLLVALIPQRPGVHPGQDGTARA